MIIYKQLDYRIGSTLQYFLEQFFACVFFWVYTCEQSFM